MVGSVRMSLCHHSQPNSDDWVTGNPNVEPGAIPPLDHLESRNLTG